MPRYDYRCATCGHEFELRQSFSEAGSGTCPECAGRGQRVYHAVPVIYKGSGFYTTDYGRPKPPAENGSKESKSKSDTDSSSTTKEKVGASESASTDSKSDSSTTKSTTTDKAGSDSSS